MSSALDIDCLVREVIERLHAMGAVTNGAASKENKQTKGTSDETAIQARVVTLATLEGRLNGVRRLRFAAGAIVTPAVKDELRRRGIAWEHQRRADANKASSATTLLVAATKGCEQSQLAKQIAGIETLPSGELADVLARLSDAVVKQGTAGVLLTKEPAAALCQANRRSEIRAAWGVDQAAVQEAIESLKANLLIIDPRRQGPFEVRRLIQTFVQKQK